MSQADILLDELVEGGTSRSSTPETEGHIIIGRDRHITVPDELKRIAVQHDNNIERATFDCPRYWDNNDLSEMRIFVNYKLSNGEIGSYVTERAVIDDEDPNLIHFDWVVSREVSQVVGFLTFLVCAKTVDNYGNEDLHWNSEINTDMYVSEGMECTDPVVQQYPDIVTQLLTVSERAQNISETLERHLEDGDFELGLPIVNEEDNGRILRVEDGKWCADPLRVYIGGVIVEGEGGGVGREGSAEGAEVFNDYENNWASGEYSHVEGTIYRTSNVNENGGIPCNQATGRASHAEGGSTIASGDYSHAEGRAELDAERYVIPVEASGTASHAEGGGTQAKMHYSHSEGCRTVAKSAYTHAEGFETQAGEGPANSEDELGIGWAGHAEGYKTKTQGTAAHAEGSATVAKGEGAHSEGRNTTATGEGAHSEGKNTTATGEGAHAEGTSSEATKMYAHAEGYKTIAEGNAAHAEGWGSKASGSATHAEGTATVANGEGAHSEGIGTIATVAAQHVQGKYNIEDTNGDYAHIIGNGTHTKPEYRRNIHTVKWNGDAWYKGTVKAADAVADDDLVNKKYVDNAIGDVESVLDNIIAIQNSLIGGNA